MHEMSLVSDLVAKAAGIVTDAGAARASRVGVRLGAMAHLSPQHLERHFVSAAAGSVLEGAVLDIDVADDPLDPNAQDLILTSVDVAWET